MGHQDKHGFFDDLDQPSQLNVQMDFEAKWYLPIMTSLMTAMTVCNRGLELLARKYESHVRPSQRDYPVRLLPT
jgi:hypothetical protein